MKLMEAFQAALLAQNRWVVAAAFPCCCCAAENLHPSDNGRLMQQAVGNLHPALNLHGWEIITGSSGSQGRVTRLSLGHAHLHGPAPPHDSSSAGLPSHQLHHNEMTVIISTISSRRSVSPPRNLLYCPAMLIWHLQYKGPDPLISVFVFVHQSVIPPLYSTGNG